jgi:uncharacterized cupredoxin-like copper-binding protein
MKLLTAASGSGIVLVAAAIAVASALAGSDASSATTVRVKLDEMKVIGAPKSVPAGPVTFIAKNIGTVEHELVVVKSNKPLVVRKYKAHEPPGATIGELEDIPVGKTKKRTWNLSAGRYYLICNIAGHYQLGMTKVMMVR